MSAARIERISIAPVKGLGLVHPETIELGLGGARGDRAFYVVDAEGRMLNAKRCGELLRVSAEHDADADVLRLTLPDGTVVADAVRLGAATETSFFGRPVTGRILDGPWAAALSAVAGEPLQLVRPESPGDAPDRGPTVSLLSSASLARIAEAAGSDKPLDGRRFRMSFDVSGLDAHGEDAWVGQRIRIGTAVALMQGHVGRCLVTSRHPDRGHSDVDTLGALATYRRHLDTTEPLALGIWGDVVEPGAARLGDTVALAE